MVSKKNGPVIEVQAVDLGVVNEQDYAVMATQAELHILVKNLVNNLVNKAIRHTPPSGRVDLSAQKDHNTTVLEVAILAPHPRA